MQYESLLHHLQIIADKRKSVKAAEEEKEKAKKKDKDKEDKDSDKDEEGDKDKDKEMPSESTEPVEQSQIPRVVPDKDKDKDHPSPGEDQTDSSIVDSEVDPIIAAAKRPHPNDTKVGTLEKIFSVLNIDKSLSLLAAILPQELSVRLITTHLYVHVSFIFFACSQLAHWIDHKRDIEVFLTEELLPSLIQLSQ